MRKEDESPTTTTTTSSNTQNPPGRWAFILVPFLACARCWRSCCEPPPDPKVSRPPNNRLFNMKLLNKRRLSQPYTIYYPNMKPSAEDLSSIDDNQLNLTVQVQTHTSTNQDNTNIQTPRNLKITPFQEIEMATPIGPLPVLPSPTRKVFYNFLFDGSLQDIPWTPSSGEQSSSFISPSFHTDVARTMSSNYKVPNDEKESTPSSSIWEDAVGCDPAVDCSSNDPYNLQSTTDL